MYIICYYDGNKEIATWECVLEGSGCTWEERVAELVDEGVSEEEDIMVFFEDDRLI